MLAPSNDVLHVSLLLISSFSAALGLAVEREAHPLITPAPLPPQLLYERDQITWAYISGDSNSPLTCPPGYTTTHDLGNQIQACCNSLQCVNDWQTCISYGGQCTDGLQCSYMYTSWVSCEQQTPGCITYESITGPNDPYPLKSYACGPSNQVVLALGTPGGAAPSTTTDAGIFGNGGLITSYATYTSSPFSAFTTIVATPTSIHSTISTVLSAGTSVVQSSQSPSLEPTPAATSTSSNFGTGSGTSSTSSSGGNSSPSSSHLDTGTIVGIVAGVISVLAIFVAIWLKWPKTITRFISCGTCTTIDDDSYRHPGNHGIPMRYIPQRSEPPYHYNDPIHYQ